MRRTNVPKVSKKRSSRRSREDHFQKEDSPNLPVPPRRKTNALSILRKIFDEYDEVQSEDSSHKQQLDPSNIQQDANEDIPDHCWVGEYLDDEDVYKTPTYLSHVSATLQLLRGKPQNLPSSSGSTLASFGVSKEVFPSRDDTDSYQTKFDDATDREIKELQRKEREREEQLCKIMLESLEYKAELERLRREASLKKSKDSAKVFDYDHGVSDQLHERPISQHKRVSSGKREDEPYADREYESRRSSHQRGVNVPPEGKHSTFDVIHSDHGSRSSRKIVEREVLSKKRDMTYSHESDIPQKKKVDIFQHGYYDNHLNMTDRPESTSKKFKILRNRDMLDDDNVVPEYLSSSGAMSSFGSALAHTAKVTKNDTSQSYEEYLDELQLKLQEEELAVNSSRRLNESLHGKLSQTSFGVNEGLPISVLTSGERVASRNDYRRNVKKASAGTPPPLKIKPALKNIHNDAFQKDMSGSGSLMESLEEMSATSRLNLGNFNDTRKVLMEDTRQYGRDGDFSQLGYSGRVVIDRDTPERASLNDETFSRNTHSTDRSLKPTNHQKQRIKNEAGSNKPFLLNVKGAVDYESDDYESEPFLHRTRPKEFENDLVKALVIEKKMSREHNESRAGISTSDYKDELSRGYSPRGRVPVNQAADNKPLDASKGIKKMPKRYEHVLQPTRKARKRSLSPSPDYYHKPSKSSDTRTQGFDGEKTKQVEVSYRHSSLRSVSRERNNISSSDSRKHRHEDTANKPNAEYIDQFFDRQIKIWSKSSNNVLEKNERLVEGPLHKSKLTWEEEVDRYVNMSAGVDKRVDSARDDRRENVTLNKQRKRGRRRDRSYNNIPATSRRDSKSHSRTPSTSRKSKDSPSSSDNRPRNQRRLGKDERRFETRSPLLDADQSMTRSISDESDFRRVTTNMKQSELSRSNAELSESHRGQLKRLESSPSPVPLMPSGWRPPKIRKLTNNNKRSANPIKNMGKQKMGKQVQNESRNVVSKGVQNEPRRNVVSKEVGGNRNSRAPLSKSVKRIPNPKRGLLLVGGPLCDASQRNSLKATKAKNMKARDGDDHIISKKPPPYMDEERPATGSSRVVEKNNSPKASDLPPDSATDAVVTCDEASERKEVNSEVKSVTQLPTTAEDKSVTQPPTTALSVVSGDEKLQKAVLTKQDAHITHCSSADTATTVHTKSKNAEVLGTEKKKVVVLRTKPKIGNLRKSSTVIGRGNKLLTKATGMKKIQKTPAKREAANSKQIKPTMPLKRKPSVAGKSNSKASNLAKPVQPTESAASSSVRPVYATATTCVDDSNDNWMERYRSWFNKVLQSTLSNDELGKKLGWDDPVQFLNCVTTGNKRAMSYIPRGAHAKELLRFIALNKKAINATHEATSENVKLDEKSGCSKVNFDGNHASEIPSTIADHQKNQAVDAKEICPDDKSTVNDEDGDKKGISTNKSSSQPCLGSKKSVKDQKNVRLKDATHPDSDTVKKDDTKDGTAKSESNKSQQLVAPITQPEFTSSPSSNVPSATEEKKHNSTTEQKGKSIHSNSGNTLESTGDVLSNESTKLASSQQHDTSTKRNKESANVQFSKINQEVKLFPDGPKGRNPETARKSKLVDNGKKQATPAPIKKTTKQQPRKNESTETVRIAPATNIKSEHESQQKKVSTSTGAPNWRESRSESRRKRKSYEEISIPTEEPMLSAAQKGLLSAFKKCVERATTRTLNILYEFDKYDKRKLAKVARDILDAFSLSKQRKHGFTTQHALFYMASVFNNPSADSLDDIQRQLRKSYLDGPQFEFTVQAFLNFKNVVVSLCKNHLDPNKSSTAQDEVKKNFVRQRSEYLFPQFSYEVDSIVKLWIWSERMQYIFHKEPSSRTNVKLEPFPDDDGQTLEDRMVTWMKRVLHRRIYNETDNYSHAMICAVKTELMKRKSHATRQEAMNLLMRLCIKEQFHTMEISRKAEEKAPGPSADLENSELVVLENSELMMLENSELVVLDEVYSDESEDENVLDVVEDSESVQIDLF